MNKRTVLGSKSRTACQLLSLESDTVRRASLCAVDWLSLPCCPVRGLLEAQRVSTLVKGQWTTCNELQLFRSNNSLQCVSALLLLNPSLGHFSNSLLGSIHLCHLQFTDSTCPNTAKRRPWLLRFLRLPRSSHGSLSLLISVQFADHFWAVGDWAGNPWAKGFAGSLALYGLWAKVIKFPLELSPKAAVQAWKLILSKYSDGREFRLPKGLFFSVAWFCVCLSFNS